MYITYTHIHTRAHAMRGMREHNRRSTWSSDVARRTDSTLPDIETPLRRRRRIARKEHPRDYGSQTRATRTGVARHTCKSPHARKSILWESRVSNLVRSRHEVRRKSNDDIADKWHPNRATSVRRNKLPGNIKMLTEACCESLPDIEVGNCNIKMTN